MRKNNKEISKNHIIDKKVYNGLNVKYAWSIVGFILAFPITLIILIFKGFKLFKKRKISKYKISIWKNIDYINSAVNLNSGYAFQIAKQIEEKFDEITGYDPKITNYNKQIKNFYKFSLDMVNFIKSNVSNDTNFECLNLVSNLLVGTLWTQAYSSLPAVDNVKFKKVKDFFENHKGKIEDVTNDIGKSNYYAKLIRISEENGKNDNSFDSNKLIKKNLDENIYSKRSELISEFETFDITNSFCNVDVGNVKSNHHCADEFEKMYIEQSETIKKSEDEHYKNVRSQDDQYIIDSQKENIVLNEQISTLIEKDLADNQTFSQKISKYLDNDEPDLVAAYAKLRFALDYYIKFYGGYDLDFKLSYVNKDNNSTFISKSKKEIMRLVFKPGDCNIALAMWNDSSDIIHAGEASLDIELNNGYIDTLKNKALNYAKFLDEKIGVNFQSINVQNGSIKICNYINSCLLKYGEYAKNEEREDKYKSDKDYEYANKTLEKYVLFLNDANNFN